MPDDGFDYGEKRDDGQYENHPTIEEGEFQQSVHYSYRHTECGSRTSMSDDIARSVARDPDYYSKTFCASCEEYVDTDEIEWLDGSDWNRRASDE